MGEKTLLIGIGNKGAPFRTSKAYREDPVEMLLNHEPFKITRKESVISRTQYERDMMKLERKRNAEEARYPLTGLFFYTNN